MTLSNSKKLVNHSITLPFIIGQRDPKEIIMKMNLNREAWLIKVGLDYGSSSVSDLGLKGTINPQLKEKLRA